MTSKPSTFNYVVSASRETVVNHSVTGSFTSEDAIDVICDKGTRIEIRTLKDGDRLETVASVPVFGRVTALKLVRPTQELQQKDWLFVLTSRQQFFILSSENGKIVDHGTGDLSERVGRKNNVALVAVDPKSRFVCCYLYAGLLTVVPFDSRTGAAKETIVMPLEELLVLDICFSTGSGRPLLCVLHEDGRNARHVKTYEMQSRHARDLIPGPWVQPNVDTTASRLLPVVDGVLLFSSTSIVHLREVFNQDSAGGASNRGFGGGSAATTSSTTAGASSGGAGSFQPMPTTLPIMCGQIEAIGFVEKERILLGDEFGGLHVLSVVQLPNQSNVNLTIELLGETSIATGICYLDEGIVFIGSHAGDSQLVRLLPERDEATQSCIELLDTYVNLGPITSMALVDVDKQGRGQLVTCSGARKDGSLRVIRNGVGVDEQCAVDLQGIKGMWPIKQTKDSRYDAFLVQSFSTETRVFGFDAAEMEIEDVGGEQSLSELSPHEVFDSASSTLFCGNVEGDIICQVTPMRIRFMRCGVLSSGSLSDNQVIDWIPPNNARITVASSALESNSFGIAVALTGGKVVLVSSSAQTVKELNMEYEVACLSLSQEFLAVGLWTDLSVRIIHVASGREVHREKSFGEDALPRSVVLTRFGSTSRKLHLLVGLGDGRLVIFRLDDESGIVQPNWKRTLALGVQPVELAVFDDPSSASKHVFAACDRPAIVYVAQNDKLLLSNVNVAIEVNRVTSFDSEQFPACLALASEEKLLIGTVNDVQRLHIKTIPLNEQPRRIAHQPWSSTFAVCTTKMEESTDVGDAGAGEGYGPGVDSPEFPEASFVRLMDDRTFDIIDSYRLDELEQALSVISMRFSSEDEDSVDNNKAYYIVGTAYSEDEPDPTRGRILVLEVVMLEGEERRLNLVVEKTTKGAVYDLAAFSGKLLASVNAKVQLYRWNDKSSSRQPTTTTTPRTTTTSTQTSTNVSTEMLSDECGYHGHTLSLFVRAEGKSIIVGDMVKSLTLLEWSSAANVLQDKARDFNSSWISAIATLDETTFLSSDIYYNMTVLRPEFPPKGAGTATDEYGKLVVSANFHWGDFINVFTKGSLVMKSKQDEEEMGNGLAVKAQPRLLFGTAGGAIGVLAGLTEKEFALLNRLQVAMNEVVTGVGGANQKFLSWRAFRNPLKTHPSAGFVDGDLVEMLLEMTSAEVEKVAELMNRGLSDKTGSVMTEEPPRVTASQLVILVEDLARLH